MFVDRIVRRLGGAGLPVLALAMPRPAQASTFIVSNFGDTGASGQLRTWIDAAAPGDTILIPPGTIVLGGAPGEDANAGGDLDILKNLTIVGSGAGLTVIDANHIDRAFDVGPGTAVTIAGLTMRNGSVTPTMFSSSGGGLLNRGGSTLLLDVVVENNFAGGGGGIANFAGTVAVVGSTVRNNSSTGITANGGGISNFDKLEITHSTISGNMVFGSSPSTLGGGLINFGTLMMRDSSVVGNSATGSFGGGLYQTPTAGTMTLVNVTIADNKAQLWGGGLSNASTAAVSVINTLIASNQVTRAGSGPDCYGAITSVGHNLVEDPSGCAITPAPGDLLGVRARLDRFGDHGGPTETYAIRRNSPAVDAGDPAACGSPDQRGVPRPQDGDRDGVPVCDIGAFEFTP